LFIPLKLLQLQIREINLRTKTVYSSSSFLSRFLFYNSFSSHPIISYLQQSYHKEKIVTFFSLLIYSIFFTNSHHDFHTFKSLSFFLLSIFLFIIIFFLLKIHTAKFHATMIYFYSPPTPHRYNKNELQTLYSNQLFYSKNILSLKNSERKINGVI
jgi:hypothetical protein